MGLSPRFFDLLQTEVVMKPGTMELITAAAAVMAAVIAAIALSRVEHIKVRLKRSEEIKVLKKKYIIPLLKSANELYNKINDIVKNRTNVCQYLKDIDSIMDIHSVGDILSQDGNIYLTSVVYQFSKYFASIEAIKKDLGLLEFSSDKKTRALQCRMTQTKAILCSSRCLEGFAIKKNSIQYRGLIMSGAQILIGESMLVKKEDKHDVISFYEFCVRIASDEDFKKCLSPLMHFLTGLSEVTGITYESKDVDFRWPKLILFSVFVLELIREIDTGHALTHRRELEVYTAQYLDMHHDIRRNLDVFKRAYPDPK